MELSCEKVSAWLQPATAGHARLVLSKTVHFFCSSLYICPFQASLWGDFLRDLLSLELRPLEVGGWVGN